MSDIPRWAEGFRAGGVRAVDGEWVRYDDHLGALAAQVTAHEAALASETAKRHAEVKAWSELSRDNFDAGYANGVSDERARIRAAVRALYENAGPYAQDVIDPSDVLAIIDGEQV